MRFWTVKHAGKKLLSHNFQNPDCISRDQPLARKCDGEDTRPDLTSISVLLAGIIGARQPCQQCLTRPGLFLFLFVRQCTVGDEGVIGDLSSESISAHFQGLQTRIQLRDTT